MNLLTPYTQYLIGPLRSDDGCKRTTIEFEDTPLG